MYVAAFFGFVLGALIGLFMAVLHFRGQESGKALGLGHGVFTVSGIVLLAVGLGMTDAGPGWWIFGGFLLAATAGLYLFSRQARGEPWPGAVIVAHGGFAIVMIVVLGLWLANAAAEESIENEPIPTEVLE